MKDNAQLMAENWDHEVKHQGHRSWKHYRRRSLHSCECWLLLIFRYIKF